MILSDLLLAFLPLVASPEAVVRWGLVRRAKLGWTK